MQTLLLTSRIVLPLFMVIACGITLRVAGLISDKTCNEMNRLVFRVFLPAYLVQSIMNASLSSISKPGVFAFIAIAYALFYGVLFIIVPRFEKEKKYRGVLIQGAVRCNYALFGIPLVASIYPDADLSLLSILIIIVVPMANTLSIFAFEINRGGRLSASVFFKNFFINPLTIAIFLGFVLMPINAFIPVVLRSALNDISKIASPLALIMLGASIDFKRAARHKRQLAFVVLIKNFIAPALFLTAACALGFRGLELTAVLICFAAPTAVNSFSMATQMGGDPDLAAECVVFTSAFSAVSVFAFVYVLLRIGVL